MNKRSLTNAFLWRALYLVVIAMIFASMVFDLVTESWWWAGLDALIMLTLIWSARRQYRLALTLEHLLLFDAAMIRQKEIWSKESEKCDRKREFLRRLGGLLQEFDVYLIAHSDLPLSVYFNDSEDYSPFVNLGVEKNKGCGFVIEADNIMDFEKE